MMNWRTVRGALVSQIEREWLKDTAALMAETFESPLLVNIGVRRGASMHCLRAGAPNADLVGIDVDLIKVVRTGLRAEFICRDSRRLSWYRPMHLLFVDGGHAYDVVRSDIRTFGKHVVIGGIMAFHDYARSQEYLIERERRYPSRAPLGVRRAVDELCAESKGWAVFAGVDSIKAFRRLGG